MNLAALLNTLTAYMVAYFHTTQLKIETLSTLFIDHVRNPDIHEGIDKKTIGLSRVRNLNTATKSQAKEGLSNSAYMTPQRTSDFADENIYKELETIFADGLDRLS